MPFHVSLEVETGIGGVHNALLLQGGLCAWTLCTLILTTLLPLRLEPLAPALPLLCSALCFEHMRMTAFG